MTNDTSNVFRLAALQDSDTELIEELAGLSALDYARRRKEAAKELNVGVAALDKVVTKERKRLGLDEDRSSPPFPSVEPATHRVLAAGLLQRLAARLKQHVVFPEEAANAVALWVALPGHMTRPRTRLFY
jgi:hypothetical protein